MQINGVSTLEPQFYYHVLMIGYCKHSKRITMTKSSVCATNFYYYLVPMCIHFQTLHWKSRQQAEALAVWCQVTVANLRSTLR